MQYDLKDEDLVDVYNIKRKKNVVCTFAWWKSIKDIPSMVKNYDLLGPCDKTKRAAVAVVAASDLEVSPIKPQESEPIATGKPTKEEIEACMDSKQLKAWAKRYDVNLGNRRALQKIKEVLIKNL